MKLTIITCDNCEETIEGTPTVVVVSHPQGRSMRLDLCSRCAQGDTPVAGNARMWPRFVSRESALAAMREGDERLRALTAERRLAIERAERAERELARLRRIAAEGVAEGDLVRTLTDVASGARRSIPSRD